MDTPTPTAPGPRTPEEIAALVKLTEGDMLQCFSTMADLMIEVGRMITHTRELCREVEKSATRRPASVAASGTTVAKFDEKF